jgi:hypothetical protein
MGVDFAPHREFLSFLHKPGTRRTVAALNLSQRHLPGTFEQFSTYLFLTRH